MPHKIYLPGETLKADDLNASFGELVNTTASYTFTGVHTHNANIVGNYYVNDRLGDVRSVTRENAKPNGYQVKTADNGRMIYATGDVIIPANIFKIGDNVSIYNSTGSGISVKQGGGTLMYLSGLGIAGDAIIDPKGLCTVICVDINIYVITTTSISTGSSSSGGSTGTVTQSSVIAAIGYFPYSQSNPSYFANSSNGFGVTLQGLLNSLGYTPAKNDGFTHLQTITTTGIFSIPSGVNKIKVYVIGGGEAGDNGTGDLLTGGTTLFGSICRATGGGGNVSGIGSGGDVNGAGPLYGYGAGGTGSKRNGANGGLAIKYITGLIPGQTIAVTVGNSGGGNAGSGAVIVEY